MTRLFIAVIGAVIDVAAPSGLKGSKAMSIKIFIDEFLQSVH